MPFPNFICIGAQKAGTTWLHYQMTKHPQIWLPPIKELHFFDRDEINRYIHHVFKRDASGRFVRHLLRRALISRDAVWLMKYVFSDRKSPSFYPSLFSPKNGQICGESTPAYGRLGLEAIKQIASLMPNCKVIYLIRNPVERAWSQISMSGREKKTQMPLSDKDLSPIKRDRMIKGSSSHTTLKYWETCFGSEQIFVGFFEQIKEEPEVLLSSLCSFLNINPSLIDRSDDLYTPKNKGHYNQIPLEVEQRLSKLFLSEIQDLHRRFDNTYTCQWLERANKVLL